MRFTLHITNRIFHSREVVKTKTVVRRVLLSARLFVSRNRLPNPHSHLQPKCSQVWRKTLTQHLTHLSLHFRLSFPSSEAPNLFKEPDASPKLHHPRCPLSRQVRNDLHDLPLLSQLKLNVPPDRRLLQKSRVGKRTEASRPTQNHAHRINFTGLALGRSSSPYH